MVTTAESLRARAADCLHRARTANPARAEQLRACARNFSRRALALHLFEHGKQVGPANVTQATFRDYLRTQRA
ncbi:hypothetical protein [Amycolatopsis thermoflava]|uniref:hypothetical protein n=1 Tax=Amycolatopsis thermoflava TaxID=84480 RepID=UPI00041C5ED8|nr:hypothetical protein [Amycolatopsis thermoflava]